MLYTRCDSDKFSQKSDHQLCIETMNNNRNEKIYIQEGKKTEDISSTLGKLSNIP